MLEKMDPTQSVLETLSETASDTGADTCADTTEELLQSAIVQFAKRLRRAGHNESAHFMDVAALVMQDQQRH